MTTAWTRWPMPAGADDRQFRQTLERALHAADLMGYGQTQQRGTPHA